MKIVFAAPYFLMNVRDGGSGTVRNLLQGLAHSGHDVYLVTLIQNEDQNAKHSSTVHIFEWNGVNVVGLSQPTDLKEVSMESAQKWFGLYSDLMDLVKPDWVFTFGGQILDMHVSGYAKFIGSKVGFFLLNLTYSSFSYPFRDVDYLFADSIHTSNHYEKLLGREVKPIGVFIDYDRQLEKFPTGQKNGYLTMINPIPSKGGNIMVQVVSSLAKSHPHIPIRVVNGRGNFRELVQKKYENYEVVKQICKNVEILDQYTNLEQAFKNTRVILVPSLQAESFGMVVVEAKMHRIPSVVFNRGGLTEACGEAGSSFSLDAELCEPPYERLLNQKQLNALLTLVIKYYEDEKFFASKVKNCVPEANKYLRQASVDRFLNILASC